jgi:hypothetical protein
VSREPVHKGLAVAEPAGAERDGDDEFVRVAAGRLNGLADAGHVGVEGLDGSCGWLVPEELYESVAGEQAVGAQQDQDHDFLHASSTKNQIRQ